MKKLLSLLLASVMALGVFAGCSSAPADAPANSDKASEAVEKPTITFYHGYFQDDWQPAIEMRKIYEEFADSHKDEFTFKPVALETGNQGVYDKCIQEIALNNLPDIVDVGGLNIIPAASEAGLALDLKPYIDKDADLKDGIGINYEQNNIDGHIYTVRDQLETIGFWYNDDLFKKAGADTPDKWKSWDDFDKAVDKLAACKDVTTPFSMNQGWPTNIVLSAHLLGSKEGREMCKSVPKTFDVPAFKNAIDFIGNSVLSKISNEYFTAADAENYREDFLNGKSAILFNGVWESGSFGQSGIDAKNIKPAVFPTSEEGKTAAIVSASPGYVVNSKLDDAKKNACIEFIKFMTSKETATKVFEKAQAMPPSTAMDYDKYIDGDYDVTVKSLAEACKAASNADYQAPTAEAVWGQDIADAVQGKYAGIKDKSKTTDKVVEELNSLLE